MGAAKKQQLSFTELLDLVHKAVLKQTLQDSVALAEKYGLSKIDIAAISKEVEAVR